MTTQLCEKILAVLDERGSVLVFPSEIVARFWRRLATEPPRANAVCERRLISWDSFKERVFDLRREDRPINATLRRIFAASLLKQNESENLFAAVVDPAYRENSAAFTGYLQHALPSLKALADRNLLASSDRPILRDLSLVYARYGDFLKRNGLFEPGWISAGIPQPTERHVIVFPELIDDYDEFKPALDKLNGIDCHPLGTLDEDSVPTVHQFENAHQEVTSVLSDVEALLDKGIDPDEIAITVAELDAYEPFLRRYAELHSIPLLFRSGQPLSQYAAGRFLRSISEAVHGDFSFQAMRALVSDRAVPWREPAMGDDLVRAGVEGGCLKRKLGRTDAREQWIRAIHAAEVDRPTVMAFYTGLRDGLMSVVNARSAGELRRRLNVFLQRFVDSEQWDVQNLKVYQRALEELKQLVAAETLIGHDLGDAYSLWLGLLDQTLYVERAERGGVPVFPYRVAAGIIPRHHFVVNASHDGTRVFDNPFRFLRDETREALQLADRDFSDDFLGAYRISGHSVSFSCSTRSFSGPRFIAGSLAFGAPGVQTEVSAKAAGSAAGQLDAYHRERVLWADGLVDLPSQVYPAQSQGLEYYVRTGARPRSVDFTRSTITDDVLRQRLLSRPRPAAEVGNDPAGSGVRGATTSIDDTLITPDTVRLSANSIDSYRACPFGHLLSGPLRIEEPSYTVNVEPPMQIGNYQHKVLEAFYRWMGEGGGGTGNLLSPEHMDAYLQRLDEIIAESVDWHDQLRSVPASVATVIMRTTREGVAALLAAEARTLSGHQVEYTEYTASVALPEFDVVLNGRIDRVSRNAADGSLLLVDYKRRNVPSRVKVVGKDGDPDTITTVQLLVYMLLLERDGSTVDRACYYQVETGKIVPIVEPDGKCALDQDRRDQLGESLKRITARTAEGMRSGDYRFPDPVSGCDSCRFRGICRAKFSVQ